MIQRIAKVTSDSVARKANARRRGISLVWTVLLMTVFVGMAGLAVDVGYSLLTAQQLQNAADAAALAGAQLLSIDPTGAQSHDKAIQVALANYAAGLTVKLRSNVPNDPAGDVVLGRWRYMTNTFTPTLTSPYAVKVRAHRAADDGGDGALSLFFGRIFGVSTVNIQREAVAMVLGPPIVTALNLVGTGLKVWGDATLDTNGGGCVVNSKDSKAIRAIDSKPDAITAPWIKTPGQASGYHGSLIYGSEPDPLKDLPPIDMATLRPKLLPTEPKNGAVTADMRQLDDNYYYFPHGLTGNLDLAPGIYIIEHGVSADLRGSGVLLYIYSGSLSLGGNAQVDLRPPAQGDFPLASIYRGITIWQPESNSNIASFHGTADMNTSGMNVYGIIYMPTAQLQAFGTISNMGNRLIVGSLDITGKAKIEMEPDPSLPGTPEYQSYLVH